MVFFTKRACVVSDQRGGGAQGCKGKEQVKHGENAGTSIALPRQNQRRRPFDFDVAHEGFVMDVANGDVHAAGSALNGPNSVGGTL
ncbi:hypothetical protein GOP47_0014265 [Adiantum capillus-veneris]|uniref:Uncharacterized protein n=1 Tax=Adiantum capillus-veneris TaxID=13818 RepID=A0A9D4ZDC3_ADICA|nr:hypothetical protein GOP47_0014265 [Adiantum capillus-veneris]